MTVLLTSSSNVVRYMMDLEIRWYLLCVTFFLPICSSFSVEVPHPTCSWLDPSAQGGDHPWYLTRRSLLVVAAIGAVPGSTLPAQALEPKEAEILYDSYASSYDQLDGSEASRVLGIDDARARLIGMARGKVLEIGIGTGLNLLYYHGIITSLTGVDISEGMLKEAKARLATVATLKGKPVDFIKADATTELVDIFGEKQFDTVIDTFSLCVMGNEGAKDCLVQLSKVVRPNGRLLLLENSRSSNPVLSIYQDLTAEAAASTTVGGKGCVYNQNIAALIESTKRLDIVEETPYAAGLFRSYVCTPRA